jgi:hypothetical protein
MADQEKTTEPRHHPFKAGKSRKAAVCSIFFLSVLLLSPWCSRGENRLFPKPPAPDLPQAGERFTDPTFKTEILRVTDRRDADLNCHVYSYWSPFNADSTRFWIMVGNEATLFDFDPHRFAITGRRPLFDKVHLVESGLTWNTTKPHILHGILGKKLYTADVSQQTTMVHLIKNFEDLFPENLSYLTVSGDNRWFSFIVGGMDNNRGVVGAYDATSDRLYTCDLHRLFGYTNVHSTTIDKGGKYVWISGIAGTRDKLVWEVVSGKVERARYDQTERAHGHHAPGTGTLFHLDNWAGGDILMREMKNPIRWKRILENPGGIDWTHDAHLSANHRDESTIFVSRLTLKTTPRPKYLDDQIFQLRTDGSSKLRSLAHHQSLPTKTETYGTYYSYPKAASSFDGNHLMFTSNWGGSPYVDVFVLKVPPRFP